MSQEVLTISGVEFVPVAHAAGVLGYTQDYITKLARDQKIDATRVGKCWYVNLESALRYKEESEVEKQRRAESLRQERLLEQKIFQSQNPNTIRTGKKKSGRVVFVEVVAIILISVIIGLGSYLANNVQSTTQNALLAESQLNTFEKIAFALYRLVSPGEEEYRVTVTSVTHKSTIVDTGTTTHTSIIVAPDEIFTESMAAEVRTSFSDEVEVTLDPDNPDTGTIVPIFRDRRGEEYRFLIAPIERP